MPGTFSNDFTTVEDAEVLADYSAIGTLKTARALNDDYKIEGSNSITWGVSAPTGTGTASQVAIVPGAPVDFSASAAHFYQWIKAFAWPAFATHREGGIRIAISSDAPPTAIQSVLKAAVAAGGTGYTLGDELSLSGGTQTQVAVVVVTDELYGVVTAVSPKATARGMYTVLPTNPVSTTGGTGSGCTLTVTKATSTQFTAGDGWIYSLTNTKEWFVGGPDTVVVDGWVCYVVDINGTPDLQAGSPAVSSVDRMGITATAIGTTKVATHEHDKSHYGSGISVKDGTEGSPVTLADFLAYDNAVTRALGVVVSQGGIFFLAGKLNVGLASQTAPTWFTDSDKVVVFQGFPVAAGFYAIVLTGAYAEVTTFQLGEFAGGVASGGVTIRGADRYTHYAAVALGLVPAIWTLTASGDNTVCKLYGCTFSQMRAAALASTSEIRFCTFQDFGTIDPNGATLDSCTFLDLRTTSPISAAYAVNVDIASVITNGKFINCATAIKWAVATDTDGRLDGTEFISGGTGHAIEFTAAPYPAEISLTDVAFTLYGGTPGDNPYPSSGSTDAAIYNNTGGHLVINILGSGTTPAVRNGAGATTQIVSGLVTLTLTGLEPYSEVRIYDAGTTTELAGTEASGDEFPFTYTYSAQSIDIVVLHLRKQYFRLDGFAVGATDATLPIAQQTDRQYENP